MLLVVYVSHVGILDSLPPGKLMGTEQCLVGRARLVGHPVVGMESGKVNRDLVSKVVQDPVAHATHLVVGVIFIRDQEVGDLKPGVAFLLDPDQGIQHRLHVGERDQPVEVLVETLQVHIGGVHGVEEWRPGLRRDIASRHGHRFDSLSPAGTGGIDGILRPDHRVVVGKGDAAAFQCAGGRGDHLRRCLLAQSLDLSRLGDIPVLTELASQVAAGRAEGEDAGAGEEVVEWLLLDRVDAEAGTAAIGGQQHPPITVFTDETETTVPVAKVAFAGTEVADNPPGRFTVMPPAARHTAILSGGLLRW